MAAPLQRRLLAQTSAARPHVILACLLGVAAALLIVAQAALLAYVIYRSAIYGASLSSLTPQLIALAAVLLARACVTGGFELSGRLGATRVMSELRSRLARQLLIVCPDGRPADMRTGDLAAAAVQGVDALESWFAGYLPQLVLACVVPLAVLGWVFAIDPVPGAILLMTVPILIVFMILIGRGAQSQTRARWQSLALLSAHFLDILRGLPTLIAHRREHAQAGTLAQVGERYRSETMATLRIAFLSAFVLELCAMIGTALVAATIGVQLVYGALSLQVGLTVLLLAPELYGPLRGLGQQFHSGNEGLAAAERIFAVLDRRPSLRPVAHTSAGSAVGAAVPDPARAPVRLAGVSYEYPGRAGAALSELDLELAPGEITALVGPSGAGKSTIARLLMRLADPTAGRVSCGGVNLRELRSRALARTGGVGAPARAAVRGHGLREHPPGRPRCDRCPGAQGRVIGGRERPDRRHARGYGHTARRVRPAPVRGPDPANLARARVPARGCATVDPGRAHRPPGRTLR